MDIKYFKGIKLVNELKTKYRELAKENHPDIGGSEVVMQMINAEYFYLLKNCDGQEIKGEDNKTRTYHFDPVKEQAVMDMLRKLHNLRLPKDVEIYIFGTWIWIMGNTKPHAGSLKFLKCNWNPARGIWQWHLPDGYRKKSGKMANINNVALMYGCTKFNGFSDKQKVLN